MDDLCCLSPSFEAHLKSLEQVFAGLPAAGLTLKPSKIQFGPREINYLGLIISANGITIGRDCVQAICDPPAPSYTKESCSVLGMVNFVRRFIENCAEVTEPLVELTRKDFVTRKRFYAA